MAAPRRIDGLQVFLALEQADNHIDEIINVINRRNNALLELELFIYHFGPPQPRGDRHLFSCFTSRGWSREAAPPYPKPSRCSQWERMQQLCSALKRCATK